MVLVKLVQQFDPVGIGARSVSECVQLQLGQLAADTPGVELAKRIAAEHLPLVAEHQYGVLKRLLRASDGEIEAAIALVRACQPRPGANVFTAPPEYVVPDVFVRRHEGSMGRRAQQLDVAAAASESALCGLAGPRRRV